MERIPPLKVSSQYSFVSSDYRVVISTYHDCLFDSIVFDLNLIPLSMSDLYATEWEAVNKALQFIKDRVFDEVG